MGAKSSSDFGQIHITTDKPSYFQGDYVYGTISLNLLKDFPGNELYLKIKGKEETRWTEGSGKDKSYYHGKKIIISHQFPLFKFNSVFISRGQYNFPFSIYMSPALPASFSQTGIIAEVSYKIKGEIKSTDKSYKHFRNSQILHLKQMKNDAYAPPIANLKVAVDICCCFGQGSTNIETRVNKTNFFQGETAYVDCSVDNAQCDLPLTTVDFQLIRRLVVKSDWGHTHSNDYVVVTRNNRLNLPAKSCSQAQTKFEIPIQMTGKIPSTCQGDLVKNMYFLSLSPHYESFLCNCCLKRVETPILIYDPKDEDIQNVQAPENWNPQVMPAQNCDWKTAQMYQGKNAGGYNYPQFDERMYQQYVPPNNPAPFNYNQPNYMNYNNNQGMNYNDNTIQGNPGPESNNLTTSPDQTMNRPLNPGNNYENYGFPAQNGQP